MNALGRLVGSRSYGGTGAATMRPHSGRFRVDRRNTAFLPYVDEPAFRLVTQAPQISYYRLA